MASIRPLLVVLAVVSIALAACNRAAPAFDHLAYTEFVPLAGRGSAVVVLSGRAGPGPYSFLPRDLVALGYYVVLLDGSDYPPGDPRSDENLRRMIRLAQQSPHAMPGKVAIIGASAGGGTVLTFATSLCDLVAVIVDYYPATRSIPDTAEVIRHWTVPTLIFAGDADNNGCCMIDTIRAIVAAAQGQGAPAELVVYPGADHDFIWGSHYQKAAADDAWQRTLAMLRQHPGTQVSMRATTALALAR
jgi:dipeptidyl aminopeptidase/acylaminoacyl peptidase